MQQARTKEEKQELIQLYKQSGMSIRAFAEEFNLNLATFMRINLGEARIYVRPDSTDLRKGVSGLCNCNIHARRKFADSVKATKSPTMTCAIKPFVIARKDFLFSCSGKGAESSCFLFSLIETAKFNGKVSRGLPSLPVRESPLC